ncbi:MAG: UDP-N-acetylmuramate dehydrogenase [Gemmatimonadetes bacterium]|nr:UDP-N-acetylmuramate dehydrogenase [Gemmatimonadota bacterium]
MASGRDPSVIAALRAAVRGEVRAEEPLARYSTYRIGGPATLVLPSTAADLAAALGIVREHRLPWFALGLGSNVLLPDAGLDAIVIRLGKGLDSISNDAERWTLGAGLPAPLAARKTAQAGWSGLHLMVGVPGTVGGGVFMNAGCHGGQWSDTVTSVLAVNGAGETRSFDRSEIPFRYRASGLEGWIVLEARVTLSRGDPTDLAGEVARLFEWRQRGTPFNQACCGSVFKNPAASVRHEGRELRTAGQLIEAAGLKGAREGDAEISSMHANYFVNTGAARADQVRALIGRAREQVAARFGIVLEPEVKLIGPSGEYQTL